MNLSIMYSHSMDVTSIQQEPTEVMIDGVRIHNHVVMNSNKGSLYTDDGPFSHFTTVKIGKNHGLCT
jgi:hypothetical protein